MKSFKTIISCATALLAATMISCNKENPMQDNGQDNIPASETISVCVDALLGEYAQENDTKASLSGAIRMKWAAGDKVYAYDATQCLGELTVSLKNGIDYFAVLSGNSLKTPVDGTTKVTLVYSNIFTEAPAIADGKIKIDLSEQTASTRADNMPFVAYGTLDYSVGTIEISNQIADFSFATSLMRLNCTGLEASATIGGARLIGMGCECLLNVTNEGASVGLGKEGKINFSISGVSASVNGAQTIYVALAKTGATEKQAIEIYQRLMYEYPFSSKARDEGKLFNAIMVQKNELLRLPGEFTIGEDGNGNPKKVYFSKGNLWADSWNDLYYFENEQWEFKGTYDSHHISHFTWSSDIASAVSETCYGDFLFCDEAHSLMFGESREKYYVLTKGEWEYLFDDKRMKVPGKRSYTFIPFLDNFKIESQYIAGLFVYPDDYKGEEISMSGAPDTWASINSRGILYLPCAGYRTGTNITPDRSIVLYWSSSSYGPSTGNMAYRTYFEDFESSMKLVEDDRSKGYSLRLVTNVR